nr:aspartic proteinase CDR1-like [Coffea arabica]
MTWVMIFNYLSHITSITGEYLIKVSIGTPPVDILAIADTGSDLTWTQCNPCRQCYEQSAPLFDPSKTSSYRKLSCESLLCTEVGTQTCDSENNCGYRVSYGDHSYSIGDLSAETFTFESSSGGSVSIPKVVFGCGHENEGTFNEMPKDSGSDASSKINFGTNAVVSGPTAVSTPLIKKNPDTFYYLNLEGFSIGNTRISNKGFSKLHNISSTAVEEGNIIIDSGTTLTYVPQELYQDLESQLSKIIRGTRVSDPLSIFGLCYKSERNIEFPKLVAHFTNADIDWLQPVHFLKSPKA